MVDLTASMSKVSTSSEEEDAADVDNAGQEVGFDTFNGVTLAVPWNVDWKLSLGKRFDLM